MPPNPQRPPLQNNNRPKRSTRPSVFNPDKIKRLTDQLQGQTLQPVEPTRLRVGKQTIILPGTFNFTRPAPTPPGYNFQQEDLSQLPNYEKLTGTERFIMNRLPGISGPVEQALKSWDGSWLGQKTRPITNILAPALSALDVGAE